MPPKRGKARPANPPEGGSPLRASKLSPNKGNPILPNIPAKQSFAYGSSTTPILPRKLEVKSKMNLEEMANTIDDAIQNAKEREETESFGSPHLNTRSRRRLPSNSASPARRLRRAPTPDQVQLFDSLRAASASPRRPRRQASNDTAASTATPTPPVPHTFSTTSSPRQPAQGLYPSPLQLLNSPMQDENQLGSSPPSRLYPDNDSVISFGVERDIHEDDLQRTRSNRYRDDTQGKHISAPPRRFSGLAFAHETIEEEEEPQSEILESKTPSHAPTPAAKIMTETQEQHEASAPTRTIISDRFAQESLSDEPSLHPIPPLDKQSLESGAAVHTKSWSDIWTLIFRIATLILVTSTSMLMIFIFVGKVSETGLNSPFGGKFSDPISLNDSGLDALNKLTNQMMRLGAQVSSLSSEVKVIKTEVKNVAVPTTVVEPYMPRQEKPKMNFLSMGLGVLIDPYLTNPTAGPSRSYLQGLYMKYARGKHRLPMPPLAALTPWEDVGECWCSVPRDGMTQLGILLGKRIVPEEAVVEHMPKSATIRPDVAPKQMELWARYRYISNTTSDRSLFSRLMFSSRKNPTGQDTTAPDRALLHGRIMETLRQAYFGEPESAFSDDAILGPHFYRIGRWTYDINEPNHIQNFLMDAVFDSPEMRVDKVVFRVKSNWGANDTCIYRLKLYGHL